MSKECCGSILPTGNNQIEVLIQQIKICYVKTKKLLIFKYM